jgi:hypothetical protein
LEDEGEDAGAGEDDEEADEDVRPFDDWVAEFEVMVEAVGPSLVRLDYVDRVTELERPTRFDFLIAILRPRYLSLLIRKKLPITTSAPPRHRLRRDTKSDHSHSARR